MKQNSAVSESERNTSNDTKEKMEANKKVENLIILKRYIAIVGEKKEEFSAKIKN